MTDAKAGLKVPAKLPSQPKQYRLLESQLLHAVASRDLFRLRQQLKKSSRVIRILKTLRALSKRTKLGRGGLIL